MKKTEEHVVDFMEMYKNEQKFCNTVDAVVDPVILICRRLIVEIKEKDRKWKAIARRLPDGLDKVVNQDAFIKVWEHFKNEVDSEQRF
jgi:hypothetical protein